MNDPGTEYTPDPGETVAAVCKQCVHKCPVGVSRRGVNYHTDRLVHYYYVTVLKNYIERDVLRLGFVGNGWRKRYLYAVARRELKVLRRRLRIHEHIPG